MANVPIVTEVTKAQLDALVTANGLNEGLQYKVTDRGNVVLLATSNNTYKIIGGLPYTVLCGVINQIGTGIPTIIEFENTLGEYLITRNSAGSFNLSVPYTDNQMFYYIFPGIGSDKIEIAYTGDGETFDINTLFGNVPSDEIFDNTPFEIRSYIML